MGDSAIRGESPGYYFPVLFSEPLPPGALVSGASTGFPFGHIIFGADHADAGGGAQRGYLLLAPAGHGLRDGAVAFDQEHRRHAGYAVGIAHRKAAVLGIEQHGKRGPVT